MKFILTPCLWLCSTITLFVGSATAQVNPVSVVEVQGRWQLLRNGYPYYVIGAGGETHLNELVDIGGNSIRTWGAENAAAFPNIFGYMHIVMQHLSATGKGLGNQ